MIKGQVISGEFGNILVRQKKGEEIELGELLISDNKNNKILLQAFDIAYGSQISQQNLELISGMDIEEDTSADFMDPHLRNYKLIHLKNILSINQNNAKSCKMLPDFFSTVRSINKEDLSFLTKPGSPIYLGKLRSGSKIIDVNISLPGKDVLSHHILIPATTGRGKSNFMSCILWDLIPKSYCAMLVLDPHDEYYGRNMLGLKDHSAKDKLEYFSPDPPPGCRTLKINLRLLKPGHFNGAVDWSPAQREALAAYHKMFRDEWIEAIILEKPLNSQFHEGTLAVVKRRLMQILNIDFYEEKLNCEGVFDIQAGMTTITDIVAALEEAKTVIIDTSSFSGAIEILIGSMISSEIFSRYKYYKNKGLLNDKPVISIVLEEAPRVLGKEVLDKGPNIFSTIAREGRKFKIGLIAITQLPSLIPRQILANMNTKIILGIEMAPERQAIIESASQDISQDARAIAALDKGEAIVTSNFARFALPIKIPLFKDFVKDDLKDSEDVQKDFNGIDISVKQI